MRLVLDTNAVISAVIGTSAPARLIELAGEGELKLFSSSALLAELANVLSRDAMAQRLARHNRSAAEVLALYEGLVDLVQPALIAPTARTRTTTPYSPARLLQQPTSLFPGTSACATSSISTASQS